MKVKAARIAASLAPREKGSPSNMARPKRSFALRLNRLDLAVLRCQATYEVKRRFPPICPPRRADFSHILGHVCGGIPELRRLPAPVYRLVERSTIHLASWLGVAWPLSLADAHGNYFLTIRSTAWFTSSRAFFLAASRRVPFSLFSDRSDWRCDLSSLVRFFAMLTVSHSPAPIANIPRSLGDI